MTRSFDVFFHLCLCKRQSANSPDAGDLNHDYAQYDVTVMEKQSDWSSRNANGVWVKYVVNNIPPIRIITICVGQVVLRFSICSLTNAKSGKLPFTKMSLKGHLLTYDFIIVSLRYKAFSQ